ncbi:hypothetical protein [Enterobacter phage 01_vB_Eclo_IJM]|nr:hypothetical protein [Enterobacter phage 01_vB_Eclo_IJM]
MGQSQNLRPLDTVMLILLGSLLVWAMPRSLWILHWRCVKA